MLKKKTMEKYGAVSGEVVTEMVEGALRNFGSDYAIAVTGIAPPPPPVLEVVQKRSPWVQYG